jgi:hypothetical protein
VDIKAISFRLISCQTIYYRATLKMMVVINGFR